MRQSRVFYVRRTRKLFFVGTRLSFCLVFHAARALERLHA